ncbi:hypothetical protein FUAX_01410 [Fulvitalea axinellae]|uniref:Uncharacterized protein n=1 Tax=Fulvitalea axinellae TaxID=1182444 RepID=A0AAU9C6U0_9BACT|nr:hypothetical protein FUAX_01410 [Fulvitalea axinellae]
MAGDFCFYQSQNGESLQIAVFLTFFDLTFVTMRKRKK